MLDARTAQRETALIYAARSNHPNVLNVLLDAGADASIAGPDGTALDVAVSLDRRAAARALRARVRDPCKVCGRSFFPLCFHVLAPSIWDKFTDEQKKHRAMRLSADLCQAHEDFFIRGIVAVPILSSTATAEISATYRAPSILQGGRPGKLLLCFGVFVQVPREAFDEYVQHWNTEGREKLLRPVEGIVANSLPYWKSTLSLACRLLPHALHCRPVIEVMESAHALYKAQREGVSFPVAERIKNQLL